MNKILKSAYFMSGILLVASMGACVKDRNTNATDFSAITPIVEIRDNIPGIGNDAGLANFAKATLSFTGDPDTSSFYVNLASEYTLDRDIVVTVDVDATALQAYNADPANTVKYELLPDSLYTFITPKQVTIGAHQRVASISLEIYPTNIDPSVSYMLPISIMDASGLNISGNFGTIYYHVIGNCLAGTYSVVGERINYVGPVSGGVVSSINDLSLNSPKTVIPNDATNTQVDYANLGAAGWAYALSYDCNGGSFTADGNDIALTSAAAGTFVVTTATYDPALKQIYLLTTYVNTSGNGRVVEEWLTKQ